MTVDKVMRGVVTAGLGAGAAALFGVLGAQSAEAAPAPAPPARPSTPAEIAKQDANDKRTAQRPKVNTPAENTKQDADDKRKARDSSATQQQRAEGKKRAEQQDSESRKAAEQKKNSSADDRKQDADDKRNAADSSEIKAQREQGRKNAEKQKAESKKEEPKRNSSADDLKQDADDKRTAADAGNKDRQQQRAQGMRAAKAEADRRAKTRQAATPNGLTHAALVRPGPTQAEPDGFSTAVDGVVGWVGDNAEAVGHGALDVVGLIPLVGEPADLGNAAWYAAEGDVGNAALSTASAVPLFGYGATAIKGLKYGEKGFNAVQDAVRVTDKVEDAAAVAKTVPAGGVTRAAEVPPVPRAAAPAPAPAPVPVMAQPAASVPIARVTPAAGGGRGASTGLLTRPAPTGGGPAARAGGGPSSTGGAGGRAGGSGGQAPRGSGPDYGKAAPLVAGVAGTGVIAAAIEEGRDDAGSSSKPQSPERGGPQSRTLDAPPSQGTAEPRTPTLPGRNSAPDADERPAQSAPGNRGTAEPRTPTLPGRNSAPDEGGRPAQSAPRNGPGADPRLAPWAVPSGPRGPGDPIPDTWGRPDPRLAPRAVPTEPSAPGNPVPGDWDLPDPWLTPRGVPTEPTSPGLPAPVVQSESEDPAADEVVALPAPVPLPALLGPSITAVPSGPFASLSNVQAGPEPAGQPDLPKDATPRRKKDIPRIMEADVVRKHVLPQLEELADGAVDKFAADNDLSDGQRAQADARKAAAEAWAPLRRAEAAKVKAGKGSKRELDRLTKEEKKAWKKYYGDMKRDYGTQIHAIFERLIRERGDAILGEYAGEYRFRPEVAFNLNGEVVVGGTAGQANKTIPDLVLERRDPGGNYYRVQVYDLKTGKKGIGPAWAFRTDRYARGLFEVITLRPGNMSSVRLK